MPKIPASLRFKRFLPKKFINIEFDPTDGKLARKLRPQRSAHIPLKRFNPVLTTPKLTTNEKRILNETTPNSIYPNIGTMAYSRSTVTPTKKTIRICRINWLKFALIPIRNLS
jgi:hypothetical protein